MESEAVASAWFKNLIQDKERDLPITAADVERMCERDYNTNIYSVPVAELERMCEQDGIDIYSELLLNHDRDQYNGMSTDALEEQLQQLGLDDDDDIHCQRL